MLRYVLIFNCAGFLAGSAFVIWAWADETVLDLRPGHPVWQALLFPGYQAVAAFAAAIMLLFNAIALYRAWREYRDTREENFLTVATPGGGQSISLRALHHSLKRTVRALRPIHDGWVRIRRVGVRDKPELAIDVHYWTYENQNLTEVETILREALHFRVSEVLPDAMGVKVLFFLTMRGIRNMSMRDAPVRLDSERRPASKPPFFTGPQYPPEGYHSERM